MQFIARLLSAHDVMLNSSAFGGLAQLSLALTEWTTTVSACGTGKYKPVSYWFISISKKPKRKQPHFWLKISGPTQPARQTCCVRKLTCCFRSVCSQMPPAWKGQKSTGLKTSRCPHVPLVTDSVKLLKRTVTCHPESSTKQVSPTDHRNSCGTSLTSLTHATTGCTAAACHQPRD